MKISEISSAMGMKFKLSCTDAFEEIAIGSLILIEETKSEQEFLIKAFGAGSQIEKAKAILANADSISSEYLHDMLSAEREDAFRCLFSVEDVTDASLEVQSYSFQSVTHYQSPIVIQVADELWAKTSSEKLTKDYVWDQLGQPAVFCLNYKAKKKQAAEVRFLSGKRLLLAHNTPRGIIAESERYMKDRDSLPIDIYIAPQVQFVPQSEAPEINGSFAEDLDKISNPATYFARWEAYNKLSAKLLAKESEEFGELEYSSCSFKTDLNGTSFTFRINGELDSSYIGRELGAREKIDSADMEIKGFRMPKQIAVGAIRKIDGNIVTTYLSTNDSYDVVPEAGILTLYTAGDRYIMKRREAARSRMVQHQAPIKYIVALIEAGTTKYELSSYKPVTDDLKKNFKKAKDLNPEQIEALRIAINTPDIALIQGPPGTGKTTVIKAICERFREIFENDERRKQGQDPSYNLKSPRILISSFQNEAVDNAISTPLPGDIPAYRKTAKRASDSTYLQYQRALDKWYTGVRDSVTESITGESIQHFVNERNSLSDEYLSYKNSGEDIEIAAKLINRYLSYSEINYPQQLLANANAVIRAASHSDAFDDVRDPFVERVEALRTDLASFEDDGRRNVKRFLATLRLRDDIIIDDTVISAFKAVCEDDFTDDAFSEYADAAQKLQKQFCQHSQVIDVKDKAVVNECLLALYNCFVNQYMSTLSDVDSKKGLILSEFITRLEQDYESVVRKYSMTTAATCQTSLDLRASSMQVFDLVVIDEAARANPLDLFIPMSMGKKIVLVGDHKQLPHMLEPDVLQMIVEDPKFKDLPEIEKSLFERLFGMFSKEDGRKRSVLLTHQFRMHPEICNFVSECFYDGLLKTSETVTPELRSSPKEINNGRALTFVNVPISRGSETPGTSKSRRAEVEAISTDVKRILEIDKKATVGIITFYSAQAAKLKQSIEMRLDDEENQHVEIGTVDAFQGKEFDYVLLSCVRSNAPKGQGEKPIVGFLEKPNRLCVAFSRAIRQLAVYGDAETLTQIPYFAKLYEMCLSEEGGCYREY